MKRSVHSKTIAAMQKIAKDFPDMETNARDKIERILEPHTKAMTCRFAGSDIDAWKKEAELANLSLTKWVEKTLNAAVGKM